MEQTRIQETRIIAWQILEGAQRLEQRLDSSLSHIKGISFSEYRLLAAISSSVGGTSRVHLAETVGRTPSGVTRALNPLEKLGFVETIKDDRDARQAKATLTRAGGELVSDAAGVVDDCLEALIGEGQDVTMVSVLAALSR